MSNLVYLDNNATTKVDPSVYESMLPYLKDNFFNPSSLYHFAKDNRDAIERSRETVAKFLGATKANEIIFTGSASESNNMALKGVLQARPERKHIITTTVEHPAIYELCKDLERFNYDVTYLSVDEDGNLSFEELLDAIRPDTAIVSIMHANNETGIIYPIEKLSKLVKMTDKEIIFHTDATQTVGKLPIDLTYDLSYVDMLSFSGHKIYAPKGIGVLYVREKSRWRPMIIGGHQEKGRRAGTENIPYIVGLAKGCEIASTELSHKNNKILNLRDELELFLIENIPSIRINGAKTKRLDNTTSVSFQSIEGESIIYALDEHGICASTGSACSSGTLAPSHVLQAMKIPFTYAHGTLRISFGRYNTAEDLTSVKTHLPRIIKRLREISPFWDSKKNQPCGFEDQH